MDAHSGARQSPWSAETGAAAAGESLIPSTLMLDPSQVPVLTSPTPPVLAPELRALPQYDIVRELGRGAMGVVYLARHTLMDRLQVLKVLKGDVLERPQAVERFLREVRLAAQLDHPNVVRALDALPLGPVFVLVMEYVEGEDLAKLLRLNGPRPVEYACACAAQAALGLQHAHDRGLVHRDIKPSNLILTRQGKKKLVKVLDFGLAKVVREDAVDGSNTLTALHQTLGTPHYLAPEQISDPRHVDIRADIYSLGCTLYHLLAGVAPFAEAGNLFGILSAHQSAAPPPLRRFRPDVPAGLASVIGRMMEKDPARRFAAPIEAARALSPFIQSRRGAAAAPPPPAIAPLPEPDEPVPAARPATAHVLRSLLEAEDPPPVGPAGDGGQAAARLETLAAGSVRADPGGLEELLLKSGADGPDWLPYWRQGDRLAETLDALLPNRREFAERFWAGFEPRLNWRILVGARDQVALWDLLDRVHDRLGERMPPAWAAKRAGCKRLQAHLAGPGEKTDSAVLDSAWKAIGGTRPAWLLLFKECLGAEVAKPGADFPERLTRLARCARAFYEDDAAALDAWLAAVSEALLGPRSVPVQLAFLEGAVARARWPELAERFRARLDPRVYQVARAAAEPDEADGDDA